jgi:arsenite/tail-anchored protein-transporting ATPase
MSAVDTFKGLFGGGKANNDMGGALNKLESLQARVANVKQTLQDPSRTQFVVVTIPTTLAVAESKRLITSLQEENIKVSSILCNQIITEDLGPSYVDTRSRAQRRCIDVINRATAATSGGSDGHPVIEVTEVAYIDTEVTGMNN